MGSSDQAILKGACALILPPIMRFTQNIQQFFRHIRTNITGEKNLVICGSLTTLELTLQEPEDGDSPLGQEFAYNYWVLDGLKNTHPEDPLEWISGGDYLLRDFLQSRIDNKSVQTNWPDKIRQACHETADVMIDEKPPHQHMNLQKRLGYLLGKSPFTPNVSDDTRQALGRSDMWDILFSLLPSLLPDTSDNQFAFEFDSLKQQFEWRTWGDDLKEIDRLVAGGFIRSYPCDDEIYRWRIRSPLLAYAIYEIARKSNAEISKLDEAVMSFCGKEQTRLDGFFNLCFAGMTNKESLPDAWLYPDDYRMIPGCDNWYEKLHQPSTESNTAT